MLVLSAFFTIMSGWLRSSCAAIFSCLVSIFEEFRLLSCRSLSASALSKSLNSGVVLLAVHPGV